MYTETQREEDSLFDTYTHRAYIHTFYICVAIYTMVENIENSHTHTHTFAMEKFAQNIDVFTRPTHELSCGMIQTSVFEVYIEISF